MTNIIDTRGNGHTRATDEQHFKERNKKQVQQAIRDMLDGRSITDADTPGKVRIKTNTREPTFSHDRQTGEWDMVVPGNKKHVVGDVFKKQSGGSQGSEASPDGVGEDEFFVHVSPEEVWGIIDEELGLPNLEPVAGDITETETVRAGYATEGTPARLDLVETFRRKVARTLTLEGILKKHIERKEKELQQLLVDKGYVSVEDAGDDVDIQRVYKDLKRLKSMKVPPFEDMDTRYKAFDTIEKPTSQAVMFCVMDISGSMTERDKRIGRLFYMQLYRYLKRNYEHIEVVFVVYHSVAKIVEEEVFFTTRENGGTVVSNALKLVADTIEERHYVGTKNIYIAMVSDGDGWPNDMPLCTELLYRLLPVTKYYAYLETAERSQNLWKLSEGMKEQFPGRCGVARAVDTDGIWRALKDLFSKKKT